MSLKFNDHGLRPDSDKYEEAVRTYAEDADKHGTYPPTILVGLGGTGAKSLQHVRRLTLERFGEVDALEGVAYLSLDTDVASARPSAEKARKDPFVREVSFQEHERLNLRIEFKDYLGPNLVNHPHIREWWDPNLAIADDFNLEQGAGQIRPLSRLCFFGNRQKIVDKIDAAYGRVKRQTNTSPRIDQSGSTRVVVVAGLAGGTGSGMFLDFAALVRQVIPDVNIEGYFVLPGVYKGAEGVFPKIAANGYAALRELNHYIRHPFKVRWSATEHETVVRGLYDRHVVFTGSNHANQHLGETSDAYALIGEQLFIDFSEGGMARWVQGVRINRAQYLMRSVDREYRIQMPDGSVVTSFAESWKTFLATFGISKVTFPSWRLLSYAAYELAAQMVGLMDPGRGSPISESVTELRDDFAYRAGFFQGERIDPEGGRRATYLIVDGLRAMRGARTGAATFEDHIDMLAQEMVEDSEAMYANATTRDDCQRRFREVQSLLGDPFSAGAGGDWAKLIDENRKLVVSEVKEKVPLVVEEFRNKPAVGPSGVSQLLEELLETLKKPADRAAYTEWFHRKVEEKRELKQSAYLKWNKQVDYAVEAHSGFLKSEGNHREAVKMASDAFRDYWQAAVQEYVCHQAIAALDDIARVLREEADRLRRVCESMFEMRGLFESYRDFFAKPARATSIHELDVPAHLQGQLLTYYLGWSEDEKGDRLQALMARGLRDMQLTTLRDIEEMLRKRPDTFRSRLFKMCFLALKGESGRTNAFRRGDDEDYVREGFIQRYSAVKMLAEQAGDDKGFQETVDRLHNQGLPWVRPQSMTGMGLSDGDVPKDCFVGFFDEGDERVGQRLMKILTGHAAEGYRPRRVKVNDPSEIIFYTECTAFPAAFVGELYDDNGLQRYYEDNLRSGAALHIHQDYHQFQDLLPLREGEVRHLKQAWKLLALGLMLGRIRADQPVADDETRFVYVYRRQVSAFEQRWESLGPEMGVIHRLMTDNQLMQTLSRDVEDARDQLEAAGRWGELLAMCDYYFHCVFPVQRTRSVAATGSGGAGVVGSAENEAVGEVRDEIRQRAKSRGKLESRDIDEAQARAARALHTWAVPIARLEGRPSPATEDLRAEEREFEWSLLDEVRGHLPNVEGFVPSRNALGAVRSAFPRLRIDIERLTDTEPPPPPREVAGGGGSDRYWYAGPSGREQNLTADDVAARVAADPGAAHRVWQTGMRGWLAPGEVAAIAAQLADQPPPLQAPPTSSDDERFHYACDKARKGQLGAAEIARRVQTAPDAEHRVWQSGWGDWKDAQAVAVIAAHMTTPAPVDDEPPPLEDDEPPPL